MVARSYGCGGREREERERSERDGEEVWGTFSVRREENRSGEYTESTRIGRGEESYVVVSLLSGYGVSSFSGLTALPDDLPNFGGAEGLVEKGEEYGGAVARRLEFEMFFLPCATLHAAPLPRLQVYPISVLAECSELCP